MATKWRLAKSLDKLRIQINAAHPDRSRVSDGSIGDTAHAARTSDHNPNAKGVVTAIDITHDPAHGVDGLKLAEALRHDPRTKYIIFAGRIWKARTGKWERYTGANRHDKHVHISVVADAKGYDSTAAWDLGDEPAAPAEVTTKSTDTDKGVTTSDKPPEETAGTPPPTPAAEVKASEVSLWARITSISIPAGVITILGGIGKFVGGLPPYVWIAFSVLALAAMIIGFLIWRDKNSQAHERTKIVMGAAADRDKNNLRLI